MLDAQDRIARVVNCARKQSILPREKWSHGQRSGLDEKNRKISVTNSKRCARV